MHGAIGAWAESVDSASRQRVVHRKGLNYRNSLLYFPA